MLKEKKNYQVRTETIIRQSGLPTDNRMYYDPIHQSWMQGNFYRELLQSHTYPFFKLIFSSLFLIVPTILIASFFTWTTVSSKNNEDKVGLIWVYLYSIIMFTIGIKIFIGSIKQLKNTKKV